MLTETIGGKLADKIQKWFLTRTTFTNFQRKLDIKYQIFTYSENQILILRWYNMLMRWHMVCQMTG